LKNLFKDLANSWNTTAETSLPLSRHSGLEVEICLCLFAALQGHGWEEYWSCCGLLIMQQSSSAMGVNKPYQER
jgi:hypothetical protein